MRSTHLGMQVHFLQQKRGLKYFYNLMVLRTVAHAITLIYLIKHNQYVGQDLLLSNAY